MSWVSEECPRQQLPEEINDQREVDRLRQRSAYLKVQNPARV